MSLFPQFPGYLYGVRHATMECIVGIHQQYAGVGIYLGISLKGLRLLGKTFHPGEGVSPTHRYAVETTREHIGCPFYPADVSGTGCHQGPVWPVGPSQTEIYHRIPLGCPKDPSRLSGDKCLKVHHIEERGLDKLGLG